MRVFMLSMVLVVSVLFSATSFAEVEEGATSFLFVQTAEGVSFDKGKSTMTLKGIK